MTDEEAFQAALNANPDDHMLRMVFADWLEERGDERGPGYRALGEHLLTASDRYTNDSTSKVDFWIPKRSAYWWRLPRLLPHSWNYLPVDWFDLLVGGARVGDNGLRYEGGRRAAEDIAALAFAKLPESRRAELLGTLTPAAS